MFLTVCKKKMTTRNSNPDHDFAVIGWVHGVDWVFGFLFSFLRVFILLFFPPSFFLLLLSSLCSSCTGFVVVSPFYKDIVVMWSVWFPYPLVYDPSGRLSLDLGL